MSLADFESLGGYLLAAWASGYVSGVMFKVVRQVIEKAGG